jgi:D-alanyl-D-alanine dipeptidase
MRNAECGIKTRRDALALSPAITPRPIGRTIVHASLLFKLRIPSVFHPWLKNLRREFLVMAGFLLLLTGCATAHKNAADLVDVKAYVPGVVLDIRYATTNNFTGQQLYPVARCCLRREAAERLREVEAELQPLGYKLKIFDGYRPLSVQKRMWAIYPHPGFVADPARGSRHNRGAAVDLTLIRLDGSDVPMPTPFDDFTERAHRGYMDLPAEAIEDRELLQRVMTKHGFTGLPTEWWHFDLNNWREYPIMDVDYSQIKAVQ